MTDTHGIDDQLAAMRCAEGDNLSDAGRDAISAKASGNAALIIKIGQDAERLIAAVIASISRASWVNALAVIALVVLSWFSYTQAREARMLEYYVMELDGKVMAARIIKPEESWSHRKRCQEEQCLPSGKTLGEALAEHYQEKKQ